MLRRILRSVSLAALTAIVSAPLFAQLPPPPPIPPLPNLEIRIGRQAPPRIRRERRTVRPSRDAVWVAGSWDWQGDNWVWIPGRWVVPEGRHARWIGPRYVREYGGWRYVPGHWSNQRVIEGDDYRRWRDEHRRDRRERRP
jgi:WXXGXW repeat (2 copies)